MMQKIRRIDKDNRPLNSEDIQRAVISSVESSEIMPAAATGTQFLKGTDDLLDLLKAFAVCQCVVLQDGFDFAQGLVSLQLHDFCYIRVDEFREGDLNFFVCQHMTEDFLIQLHATTALVLISSTINILMKICGIVNSINQY